MRILIISILTLFLAFSCYYDNEEELYPSLPGECDTSSISFSIDVEPIFSSICYTCHSSVNAPSIGGNTNLEGYSNVLALTAKLLSTIKHEPGVSPMPKGGSPLSDCKINTIEAWIAQGKLDN